MDLMSKEKNMVKIRIEAVGGGLDKIAGRYPESFMNEMARQLLKEMESSTGVSGIADSSVELVMIFAPNTYMEHTSGNLTYRRLVLIDAVSAPRDFWIKWTRLEAVSGEYTADNILFEIGEDVEQSIRQREFKYLLQAGGEKYHNSMGRKKVTEWREVIKRAAKRGELTKVESDLELAPETIELEERIADLLGKKGAVKDEPLKAEVPYIEEAPESDEYARAMEKARLIVEGESNDEPEELTISDTADQDEYDQSESEDEALVFGDDEAEDEEMDDSVVEFEDADEFDESFELEDTDESEDVTEDEDSEEDADEKSDEEFDIFADEESEESDDEPDIFTDDESDEEEIEIEIEIELDDSTEEPEAEEIEEPVEEPEAEEIEIEEPAEEPEAVESVEEIVIAEPVVEAPVEEIIAESLIIEDEDAVSDNQFDEPVEEETVEEETEEVEEVIEEEFIIDDSEEQAEFEIPDSADDVDEAPYTNSEEHISDVEEITEETEDAEDISQPVEQVEEYSLPATPVAVNEPSIAERVADIRAELETKIRLEYEIRAREKAEAELTELRRKHQKLLTDSELAIAELKAENQRLRREHQRLIEQVESERFAREAEEARRRVEEIQLREQIEQQLRAEAAEREKLAESAREALAEQQRLEIENARIARERDEEARAEAEKRRQEEHERELAAIREAEVERIRREQEEAKERAKAAMPEVGDGKYSYTTKVVKLVFQRHVDPNITTRIQEVIKTTVEYYGKDGVSLRIRASIPEANIVLLEFVDIPLEEMPLLGNIIKVLGNVGLGIKKAIVE